IRDDDLALVQQALKLAAAVLARDPAQLPGQLLARLPPASASMRIQVLRERTAGCAATAWLCPLSALLTPAGSPNVGTLPAHGVPVVWLALSEAGSLLAAGSSEGSVGVGDGRRGRTLGVRAGHRGGVRSVPFSVAGELVASVGEDSMLGFWDRHNGTARAQ